MSFAVARAKTAFQFFQADRIGDVKKELGADATMGFAMSELSSRWKNMSREDREPWVVKERKDRKRFEKESAEADMRAIAIQEERRNNLVAQKGETSSMRGARARVAQERAVAEEIRQQRRISREAETDPEILEERRRIKAQKKAETLERKRKRDMEEQKLKERHLKLNKESNKNANKRLDYLLKQSSIFAKLKKGSEHDGHEDKKEEKYTPHHRDVYAAAKGKPINKGEEEEEDESGSDTEHVFLSKQPSCIKFGTLKNYQMEGLNWMIHLAEKGLNGILADEMGLGKTLQSISILAYHFEYQNLQGPHLIVVPKSTLSNWMNELARWCPSLRAIRFHGSKEDRENMIRDYFHNDAAAHDGKRPWQKITDPETGEDVDDNSNNPRQWDVCVTTYEVCNTESNALGKFAWKYLVIDEAHRLKNEASIFSKTVRTFNTVHRLLLTGTPLQNNLHELWALLNFLLPDIFSSADQFDEWFDLEIDDEDAKKDMISQLHKILRPFMLRRLKSDVAKGLPPKTETLIMVGMSKMQKQLYKKLLLRDIDSITSSKTSSKNKTAILNIVMQLRKCCGHPYLFEGVEDRTLDPLGEHLVENCGKLAIVDKLLKKLKERGSRVLIFTQMTRILDILEDFMFMRGHKYCRIDGNTDYETREASIEAFNKPGSEKFCFILSTRAGGLGINLQTADTCILYDSDWNPQADLQAQDRCHRLGQKKPVNVYRLVTENTVEEKIVERAQQKLKLDAMVVQQGRLKEKDKVSKEEIMAAVRFGADTIFRSEESTITDEDIDAILERGKNKTKELAEKLQKADKGDLLDFRLDGGISAQTFEGVDYSDVEFRKQLKLLAADSMGKRERRPPPTNYNPITQPKKSMMVNNRKIKLPKSLRIPRMEDHQFYNRERLLELSKLEFQTYATLKQLGQLPAREVVEKSKTLLPPELAAEKIELLEEGFGQWTRSQYFQFIKAAAKFGRDDLASIATDMELPMEAVEEYSAAFWNYGPTELKKDEWERVLANIEKGEQKIAKKRKLSKLLQTFVNTFDNPRTDMIFANKGTAHFALEQDRALLCSVDEFGYGNWDNVRKQLRHDEKLLFQHTVHGMNTDSIAKRCDYRMRQLERELEMREKKLKSLKPPNVIAAENTIKAIKEMEEWDAENLQVIAKGEYPPPLGRISSEARSTMEERLNERQTLMDRLREIEMQVRGCEKLAGETRKAILRGDQYVNYSNITLKTGGSHALGNRISDDVCLMGVELEAQISPQILRVPLCGQCKECLDKNSRKLCVKRKQLRHKLISEYEEKLNKDNKSKIKISIKDKKGGNSKKNKDQLKGKTSGKKESDKKKVPRIFVGSSIVRANSLGNKRMSVPDELLPELCEKIGANGTRERMKTINDFVMAHPKTSIRQVTMKFSEITTKELPKCIPEPDKAKGRAIHFFLRPRFYKLLSAESRPDNWEKFAKEDELLWQNERSKKKENNAKERSDSTADDSESKSEKRDFSGVEKYSNDETPKKKRKMIKQ